MLSSPQLPMVILGHLGWLSSDTVPLISYNTVVLEELPS